MANKINPRALEFADKWGNESLPEDRRSPSKQRNTQTPIPTQFSASVDSSFLLEYLHL